MYMNLKPNKHKRIYFNTTTMASLGFIGPPPNLIFCSDHPQLFWSEIFKFPLKLGGLLPCLSYRIVLKSTQKHIYWQSSSFCMLLSISCYYFCHSFQISTVLSSSIRQFEEERILKNPWWSTDKALIPLRKYVHWIRRTCPKQREKRYQIVFKYSSSFRWKFPLETLFPHEKITNLNFWTNYL